MFSGVSPTVPTSGAPAARWLRARFSLACAALLGAALCLLDPAGAAAQTRTLELYFTHTKENLKVVYKRNGRYDASGLRDLNRFLRDWRRNESTRMDPELFDLLWEMQQEFGGKIHVVSAYRSPATNSMLRSRSRGVAKNSQHMAGKAIDFYIAGANLSKLRAEGMKRQVGGVGYYPRSGSPFVHFDTGSVRAWPRMSYGELSRLFPDGKTLHIASNGRTLKNYAAAKEAEKAGKLASLDARGGGGGGFNLFGFGGSGRQVAAADGDAQRGILPQTSRSTPEETQKKVEKKKPEPKDEPVRVRTASLGPTSTGDAKDEGGFFRALPGASLGGLIDRFRRDDNSDEAERVTPVALPEKPLTAVAVEASAESERVVGANETPPVPRLAPAELRNDRAAPEDATETPDDDAGPVVLAALPPQRPELDGIATDVATRALGYARGDTPILDQSAPLGATAALVPRREVDEPALESAPLGQLGAISTTSSRGVLTAPVVRTSLSPLRGASPLLIADSSGIEESTFSDFTAPDRVTASKDGLLLADGFLGAPSSFSTATNWPSTESFTGLRITVFARPRS